MIAALATVALMTDHASPHRWAWLLTAPALAGLAVSFLLPTVSALAPLLVVATGAAGLMVLRWLAARRPGHLGAYLARQPRVRWAGLLALALGLSVYGAAAVVDGAPVAVDDDELYPQVYKVDFDRTYSVLVFTDRGREIPLAESLDAVPDLLAQAGQRLLAHAGLTQRVIPVADPDARSNCHGWVFTGGRYWVRAKHIDLILADNGYALVDEPAVDDVVIYRDVTGAVTHTGLVRGVARDGRALVESKWASYGRFLHLVGDHPYGGKAAFYHSARPGHLLRGLEAASPPPRRLAGVAET